MIGGHFRTGQAYTRTVKLVVGEGTPGPDGEGSNGNPYRSAISHGLAYFPYSQGWKAGYIDDVLFSGSLSYSGYSIPPGIPMWKHGDGWGLWSGTALSGVTAGTGNTNYDSPEQIFTWVDATNGVYDGLGFLKFPGVNSLNDGMLFTIANDEANGLKGPYANNAAATDGSGWWIAVRDIAESSVNPVQYAADNGDAGSSFSFLYIPWDTDNLIGGHISGSNGTTIKGAGNYSISRLGLGRYALTIPGKTDTNGTLMLLNSGYLAQQPSGYSNVVDTSFMSYEYGGTNVPANAFIISSVFIAATNGEGEGVVQFRDADFNFAWVDFNNPLAPAGTTPPVLGIARSGTNAIVSWSNGPGFVLQESPSLSSPSWSNLGTNNPQTVPITSTNEFFRVVP